MGYTNVFSDIEDEFSNFLGSFFGNALPARTQARRCETCGSFFLEIANTGQVGCAECYDVFGDELFPLIRRIHGDTTHCGQHSDRAVQKAEKHEPTKEEKIAQLKNELDAAVKEQNFERAAELRDTIKGMEA